MIRDDHLILEILNRVEQSSEPINELDIEGYTDIDLINYHVYLLLDGGFIQGELKENKMSKKFTEFKIYRLTWKGQEKLKELYGNIKPGVF